MTCWRRRSYFNPRSSCEERRNSIQHYPYDRNFNPRSSCEERLASKLMHDYYSDISIHAPHARSDLVVRNPDQSYLISIHAPHARSDSQSRST